MDSDVVPPSSPPHASTANIPSSPLPEPQNDTTSPKSSSPPPMFSSDDSRESVDIANYQSPRIYKNKRQGTWWDDAHSPHEAKKTKMSRNYDSGVYMLSDATDSSECSLPQHKSPFGCESGQASSGESRAPEPQRLSYSETVFDPILFSGLEQNSQHYIFSDLKLLDRDIQKIGQLASVIKNAPDSGNDLPAERQYRSMTPEIHVDLRNNYLSRLTPTLFSVQHITSLVLENNLIEELPPQIGQLRNLKYLNISRNDIPWLPYEMLTLFEPSGCLTMIGDSGVPFVHPKAVQCPVSQMITTLEFWLDRRATQGRSFVHELPNGPPLLGDKVELESLWVARFYELYARTWNDEEPWQDQLKNRAAHPVADMIAASHPILSWTPVAYFDQAGNVMDRSPHPVTSNADDFDMITEYDHVAYGVPSNWYAPPNFGQPGALNSLATASAHSALRLKDLDDLSITNLRNQIGELMPPQVDAILTQAERNALEGYSEFRKCHLCEREYVIARAEWIEWRLMVDLQVYPFKVKVCSWGCVPESKRHIPPERIFGRMDPDSNMLTCGPNSSERVKDSMVFWHRAFPRFPQHRSGQ